MSLNEEVDVLRQVPLFARIDPAKLKLLAFTSERLAYPAGSELFHQGDPGDSAYIILDGEADILVDSPGGEIVVAQPAATLSWERSRFSSTSRAPRRCGRAPSSPPWW